MGSGKAHGKNLVFKLDTQAGVLTDITAWVQSVDGLPGERDEGDVTAGGASGYAYMLGLIKASISLKCVFDDSEGSAFDVVKDYFSDTDTRSFEFGPAGSTAGYAKISGECRIPKVNLPADVKNPNIFTINLTVDGVPTIGTWS
jgi:hypothetical protein